MDRQAQGMAPLGAEVSMLSFPECWSMCAFWIHDGIVHRTGTSLTADTLIVIAADISAWLASAPLPAHAYAVIVTRGHTNDLEALRALAPRELRYLGLIGSRAKVARIYDALTADRMPADHLKRVHAPIGLDIGAVTPQEIAVSILAELIAVKHGKIASRDASELSMKWNNLKT